MPTLQGKTLGVLAMNEIKCDYCGEVYDFEDDGSVDCMPDGWILPTHEWICLDCGSCPECGKSLEKEPEKRGPNPKLCRECSEFGLKGVK